MDQLNQDKFFAQSLKGIGFQEINPLKVKEAILIREVESKLLSLFSQGKLNGTIHTCVGQEFVGVAFAGQLNAQDIVFSNHRCHGHFISFTKDAEGLIAELMGKSTGVCGGIGGSQHLCKGSFFSNGVQGGIVPVAAGMALAGKLRASNDIAVVFMGDGMLGEGIVYETMNIASKWNIPLLMVCENNYYAQSTRQADFLSGDILKRAEAFDIKTFKSSIWDPSLLMSQAERSITYVRENKVPVFHVVEAYRLNSHSKGDDNRDQGEIEMYRKKDPLNVFAVENPELYQFFLSEIRAQIDAFVEKSLDVPELSVSAYVGDSVQTVSDAVWKPIVSSDAKQVDLINQFFKDAMQQDDRIVFIGEDVLSPYGGAFKVAKDLSALYPKRVFTTPISEAAITGISNGLALAGARPFLEIMFGDFVTLSMDQIINHASKFFHMYNKQIQCPVVIRLPMGGGRGYGPTHSQTLDKLLCGIPNVKTIALNFLVDPREIYKTVWKQEKHPVIVIENKLDYGRKTGKKIVSNYVIEQNFDLYPVVRVRPVSGRAGATIVCYGGTADTVLDCVEPLFVEFDLLVEIIILSRISPLDVGVICDSVKNTKRLYVVEEGVMAGGFGSEVIASVIEKTGDSITARRIGSMMVPIPSSKTLETEVLPSVFSILKVIGGSLS